MIAIILIAGAVGFYFLGYFDGKYDEQAAQNFERMDEIIKKLAEGRK